MKLSGAISCQKSRCYKQKSAGSIMAEAAIGLALLVFVWIIVSYTNYMGINRIRTNMAARHSAWLSGHGADPTANGLVTSNFFVGNDYKLVTVSPPVRNKLSFFGVGVDLSQIDLVTPAPYVYSNSVSFGVANVDSSSPFPFNLLMVNVPFMPTDLLQSFKSFTVVSSHCAWPADIWDISSEPTLVIEALEGIAYAGILTAD
jgi:hypothetical protein